MGLSFFPRQESEVESAELILVCVLGSAHTSIGDCAAK